MNNIVFRIWASLFGKKPDIEDYRRRAHANAITFWAIAIFCILTKNFWGFAIAIASWHLSFMTARHHTLWFLNKEMRARQEAETNAI